MRGTVIKRGNSWAVVVEVGRDPNTGKRARKWHSGGCGSPDGTDVRG
ncbi:MAG: hypothetical protein ACRD0W_08735 [Acidimicrobiales bacterium]